MPAERTEVIGSTGNPVEGAVSVSWAVQSAGYFGMLGGLFPTLMESNLHGAI